MAKRVGVNNTLADPHPPTLPLTGGGSSPPVLRQLCFSHQPGTNAEPSCRICTMPPFCNNLLPKWPETRAQEIACFSS